MTGFRACLVDVYDTLLSCDFRVHATEMPVLAGVEARPWNEAFITHGEALNDGKLTMADAYAEVLRWCGKEQRPPRSSRTCSDAASAPRS